MLKFDTYKLNCSYAHQKSINFPQEIFTKLTNAQQYEMQTSYTKFHPTQSIYNCAKYTTNFILHPLCKVRLCNINQQNSRRKYIKFIQYGLQWATFSLNCINSIFMIFHLLYATFAISVKKCIKQGKGSFVLLNKFLFDSFSQRTQTFNRIKWFPRPNFA